MKLLSPVTLLSLACIPPPVAAQTQGLDAFRELRGRLISGQETASLSASMTMIAEKPSLEAAKAGQSRSNGISSRSVPKGRYTDATDHLPLTASTSSDDPKSVVRNAACRWGVPPDLAVALFEHESGIRNDVVGEQGEIGSAQILPATANKYGFDVDRLRNDFAYNVDSGVRILRDLADRFPNDWHSVLRAYNGGPDFTTSSRAARIQTVEYASQIEAGRIKHEKICP